MQTSAHIFPCLPVKHNTSFSWLLLETTVDFCGYTLSISLSTTMILNLLLILFQAREFEMAILFEVPSWNTLQICAQLIATTCSCCCYLSSFLYNHKFSRPHPPGKKKKKKKEKRHLHVYLYTDGHTDRQTLTPYRSFQLWGYNWLCTVDPHDSWNQTCPLPYPSSPASWTLLSLLSEQDSRNISLNDRHHHKLSSPDNNKTGMLYLFRNVSLTFISNSRK